VADIIREMPRDVNLCSASTYDQIVAHVAETQHGPKLAELHQLRQGIGFAKQSMEAGEEDVRGEIGIFHVRDWEELTANVKPAAPVPWLKRFPGFDRLKVLDVDRASGRISTRDASDEEIASGREFASLTEFHQANGKAAA